jgi:hypothetical protein
MEDYSVALVDLAMSLEAGDAMSAVAAADALSYAMDQLEQSLPGMPTEGKTFIEASRGIARDVKQSVADSPQMSGLLEQLTESFGKPAFVVGGDAIDDFSDEQCPEVGPSAGSPSAS